MPLDPDFWTQTFGDIIAQVLSNLPALFGAIIWLLIGWIVARLVAFILSNLLRRLGLDKLADRAGAGVLLTNMGLDPSVSRLVGRIVYWLTLLVFILAAAESLGLQGVAAALSILVGYLPNVLAAVFILLIGGFISRFVADALGALASQSGLDSGPLIGQAVRYILLIFVGILALSQLGIETSLLNTVTIVLLAAASLALALAFGIGSRGLAQNIMAGMHAKEAFVPGDQIHVGGHTGRLLSIGTVKAILETESGLLSLPNAMLTDEEVTVFPETEPDSSTAGAVTE